MKNFSKLPMRQLTHGNQEFGRPGISKLPMRQLTMAQRLNADPLIF